MEVIGTAQNGHDGIAKIKSLKPDVVTLDVEMPGLDGLGVLKIVMKDCPLPIVMVSTKTQKGAHETLEALRLGAVECVAKPLGDESSTLQTFSDDVIAAVRTAAASNRKTLGRKAGVVKLAPTAGSFAPDALVAIGISAGGPATLHEMIPAFPAEFPPIIITQHMPADFTGPFAARLGEISKVKVSEARHEAEIKPGCLIIAAGDRHLRVVRRGSKLVTLVEKGPKVAGFRPSVDVLFESVAATVGSKAVGVVMTGMGLDGSAGIKQLKTAGAYTIAQDKSTSVVFGMPKAAFDTGCIDKVAALQDIPTAVANALCLQPA